MWAYLTSVNWGVFFGWAGVIQSVLACIGFGLAGNWRLCLYYLFAALITLTVIWR